MPSPGTGDCEDTAAGRFGSALAFLSSFTDYEQLLQQAPARTTFDLDRMRRLLDRLGAPDPGAPVVHVTGTKGKTSTSFLVDALLRGHGLRTFRFLSPHVERIHERLAIDGRDVDDATFADLVDALRPVIHEIGRERPADLPSFFEAMTAMGFLLSRRERVDAAVIEVGLGGRLDATNVVDPAIAIVTGIGLDHVRVLGPTLEAIAAEKAGILVAGRPAATALAPGTPAFDVVAHRAAAIGAPLLHPGNGLELHACRPQARADGGPALLFSGRAGRVVIEEATLAAGATHQAWNALLALAAADRILELRGTALDPVLTRRLLAGLTLPGRAEWFPGQPPVLLDGAHTAESVADLLEVAIRVAAGRPLHLLCGLTRDRDPGTVFASLAGHLASVTATELPSPRTQPATAVVAAFPDPTVPKEAVPLPAEGLARALAAAGREGVVLTAGSLYLAGAVRPVLRARAARLARVLAP